jgi:diaminopimelate epimerase
LGNDFIIVNAIDRTEQLLSRLTPEKIAHLCQVKYGIGADGVILLNSSAKADFAMRLFNSDGSEAELSGNGLRCLALFIKDSGLHPSPRLKVETVAGEVQLEIISPGRVRVWMPSPVFDPRKIPMNWEQECIDQELEFEGKSFKCTVLAIGNPHCVIYENFDVGQAMEWGPIIERAEYFPQRINVEFVELLEVDRIRAVVYERGSGITEACGSGACASVIAGIKTKRLKFNHPVAVELLGGELIVAVSRDFKEVILEGEARKVYKGEVEL